MKYKSAVALAVFCVLLVLPTFAPAVSAQEQANYYVTVKPAVATELQYLSAGKTASLQFEALWTYGPNQGTPIANATATINVIDQQNKTIETLNVNTTTGLFSFNYLAKTAQIFTFNTTKLVTQDGVEWNSAPLDSNTYGFTSDLAQVWWDTFQVSMVSYDTDSYGKVTATVNVTYLLLPEEGLVLSSAVNLSKIADDLAVTINGVEAQETEPGIYTAASSTWLPTAYVNVKVSRDNWTTTAKGFSLTQYANQPFWIYGVAFAAIFASAVLALRFFASKRAGKQQSNNPFFGAVTLIATCVVSIYWTIVAVEGILHTFDWVILAVFGVFATVLGFVGVVMLMRKKNPALVITAAMVPMIMNTLAVNASLGMYQLANPWFLLFGALLLSVVSVFFINGTKELFQKQTPNSEAL